MWLVILYLKAENFSHKQLVLVATPVSTGVYFFYLAAHLLYPHLRPLTKYSIHANFYAYL